MGLRVVSGGLWSIRIALHTSGLHDIRSPCLHEPRVKVTVHAQYLQTRVRCGETEFGSGRAAAGWRRGGGKHLGQRAARWSMTGTVQCRQARQLRCSTTTVQRRKAELSTGRLIRNVAVRLPAVRYYNGHAPCCVPLARDGTTMRRPSLLTYR